MKIRHGIIISIALFIISAIILNGEYLPIDYQLQEMLTNITGILWLASLGLIAYLIIRSIFRTIKGAVTGTPQSGDYQSEARRACERVTHRKTEQDAFSLKD